jgi:hypothetical protein
MLEKKNVCTLFFLLLLKDEMIRRLLLNNASFCSKQSSYLLSLSKKRLITPLAYYHSDSIEDNSPEENVHEEQRLSSNEATKILRTHEASIDLEANCPVKYYEVNYLGANNPPGMST